MTEPEPVTAAGAKKPARRKRAAQARDAATYDRRKEWQSLYGRAIAAAGRELGEIPAPLDPARREACRLDLRRFCETYFAATFCLPWSPDHVAVIGGLEAAVLHESRAAVAMPRGSGKTSLSIAAATWALLYAHRRFLLVIAATEAAAVELLELIRADLENPGTTLGEDFPEVLTPIAALKGINHRAAGQTHNGKRTAITLTDNEIVLPTIEGSAASGAILRVAGLLGRIRGAIARLPDGSTARPDLVIVDDPQTDESAASLSQCAQRERVLSGTVLGLAGPGKKVSAVATVTVLRSGDVADRLLDRNLHPEWNGRRTRMLYSEPKNAKLWEQYSDVRAASLRQHGDIRDATAFYIANRAELDEGARVAWPERFARDEASAVQHAMNLKLQDPASFAAEYQNDPLADRAAVEDAGSLLSPEEIMRRLSGLPELVVPEGATRLTASIDVQQRALYWLVAAWADDFTGNVVAYGTYPRQPLDYFAYSATKTTLQDMAPGAGIEGAILAGLQRLTDELLTTDWKRPDGRALRICRCLIDANWRQSTEVVYQVCRRSAHAAQLLPSHGSFFGLSAKPLSEWMHKPGDRVGLGWRVPIDTMPRQVRFDSGLWKSHVHARLATAPGDRGALALFGKQPGRHRMIAEHLTSETRERMRGSSRIVDVWTLQANRDNHLLDCLVGAAVAASIEGVVLPGMAKIQQKRPAGRPPMRRPENRRQSKYPSFGVR